jgi:hypothetical protein
MLRCVVRCGRWFAGGCDHTLMCFPTCGCSDPVCDQTFPGGANETKKKKEQTRRSVEIFNEVDVHKLTRQTRGRHVKDVHAAESATNMRSLQKTKHQKNKKKLLDTNNCYDMRGATGRADGAGDVMCCVARCYRRWTTSLRGYNSTVSGNKRTRQNQRPAARTFTWAKPCSHPNPHMIADIVKSSATFVRQQISAQS